MSTKGAILGFILAAGGTIIGATGYAYYQTKELKMPGQTDLKIAAVAGAGGALLGAFFVKG